MTLLERPWLRFAAWRGVALLASIVTLITAAFLTTHLVPGDPARAGLGPTTPPSVIAARRATLHLDEPFLSQYERFVGGAVTGDFGRSFQSNQPVSDVIRDRFPATARLALLAFAVTMLIAVPLGMTMAVLTRGGHRRTLEASFSVATGLLVSLPEYLFATGLVALFAVTLDWLPVAGDQGWRAYVLPVAALATLPAALLARITRVETLKVLDQEYIRVARSKRLPARVLYARHALPNIVTATLTVGGLLLGAMIAGTVIIENIFAWPGMGSAVVDAIVQKDYPLVQAIVLILGAIVLLINLAVDVLLGWLDPRSLIRES
jgi:peptide/nickel transport system permease protein